MRLIEHVHSHTNQIVLAGLNVKMFEYYEYLNISAVKFVVSSDVNFIQFNDALYNITLSVILIPPFSEVFVNRVQLCILQDI